MSLGRISHVKLQTDITHCKVENVEKPSKRLNQFFNHTYTKLLPTTLIIRLENSPREHQASYNISTESLGKYCKKCASDEMVDVRRPVHEYCIKCVEEFGEENRKDWVRAHYNQNYGDDPLYCRTHMSDDMVDVLSRTCQKENCKKQPRYNYEGQTIGIYCKTHIEKNMIHIGLKCEEEGCYTQPTYNYDGHKGGKYCVKHAKQNMVDVVNPRCKTFMCGMTVSKKYQGYCLRCFMENYPDEPVSRNYKTKEKCVVDFISEKFPDWTIIWDKKIQDGCSRRRPDMFIDFGEFVLVIEIDEEQHSDYGSSCENKRLMLLSQDIFHRSMVVIRFNPDSYIDKDQNKITSCWGLDSKGICVIKKCKKNEWNTRLLELENVVRHYSKNGTDKTVEVVPLFYSCS